MKCDKCKDKGYIPDAGDLAANVTRYRKWICPDCHGTGEQPEQPDAERRRPAEQSPYPAPDLAAQGNSGAPAGITEAERLERERHASQTMMAEGIMQCIDASWRENQAQDWTRPELVLQEYVDDIRAQLAAMTERAEQAERERDEARVLYDQVQDDLSRIEDDADMVDAALQTAEHAEDSEQAAMRDNDTLRAERDRLAQELAEARGRLAEREEDHR